MLADPVRNNFISVRVIVYSNYCLSLTNTGHASTPYKSTGKHLARNKLITTSSTLLKTELNTLKYCLFNNNKKKIYNANIVMKARLIDKMNI